ncbi:MAG: SLC13 family permease [Desulfovibrionaceae bacterium]
MTQAVLPSIVFSPKRLILFIVAVTAFFLIGYVMPTQEGLTPTGQLALGLMVAGVIVWVGEVFPLTLAALLMTVMQPIVGVAPLPVALQNFANPIVFFMLGMFCFTFAFTRTGFSERVALWISLLAKGSPSRMVLCFIMGGTIISMFMADVPVVIMLTPVALKVLENNNCKKMSSNFARCILIGLPMGVLMGGIATPTGASMNLLTMQFLHDLAHVDIYYLEWSAIGVPVALLLMPIVWQVLMRLFPLELDTLVGSENLSEEYRKLGPMSREEIKFVIFMLINVILWSTDRIHGIPLPVLAVVGGALLFFPGVDLIDWEYSAPRMGWEITMLTGGACSLSMALWQTGAAAWIGKICLVGLVGLPVWMLMGGIGIFAVLVHALVPNSTAIIAVFMPTVIAMAQETGINPALVALPLGFMSSASLVLVIDSVQLVTFQYRYYSMLDYLKAGMSVAIFWTAITVASVLFIGRLLGLY